MADKAAQITSKHAIHELSVEQRIREIFLERRASYTFAAAVHLLEVDPATLTAKIERGELEVGRGPDSSYVFTWPQLAFAAMDRWTLAVIVDALGDDAARVLPAGLVPRSVTYRLPRYQIEVIEALARECGTDADSFLADHLLELCEVNAEELEGQIPGLREAFMFPDEVSEQRK